MTDRRTFLSAGWAVLGSLMASPCLVAAPAVPFCGFSLRDGWFAFRSEKFIDTRKAAANDKSGVPQAVQGIEAALGIDVPIDVYLTKKREDNAFATVAGGRKILVADGAFLQQVNTRTGTEWAAIQVLSHEVGHHIAGFDSDRHRGELNADYWSGQALQRMGASREAATAAILTLGTDGDTESHPNKSRRSRAIGKGWDDALGNFIDYSFCLDCK